GGRVVLKRSGTSDSSTVSVSCAVSSRDELYRRCLLPCFFFWHGFETGFEVGHKRGTQVRVSVRLGDETAQAVNAVQQQVYYSRSSFAALRANAAHESFQ